MSERQEWADYFERAMQAENGPEVTPEWIIAVLRMDEPREQPCHDPNCAIDRALRGETIEILNDEADEMEAAGKPGIAQRIRARAAKLTGTDMKIPAPDNSRHGDPGIDQQEGRSDVSEGTP